MRCKCRCRPWASAGEQAELQRQLANANWEIARLQEESAKDAARHQRPGPSTRSIRAQLSADSIVGQAEEHAPRSSCGSPAEQHRENAATWHGKSGTGRAQTVSQQDEDQRLEQLRGLLRTAAQTSCRR